METAVLTDNLNAEVEPFQPGTGKNETLHAIDLLAYELTTRERRGSGGTKYGHAQRLKDTLLNHGVEITPAFNTAIGIHDLVTIGIRKGRVTDDSVESDHPHESLNHNFLHQYAEICRQAKPEDLPAAIYALGIALAARDVETLMESWRFDIHAYCSGKSNLPFMDEQLRTILNNHPNGIYSYAGSPDAGLNLMKSDIWLALNDGGHHVTPEMRKWRPPMSDYEAIEMMLMKDLEAILIKLGEIDDNIKHPNPDRPAAVWRDAVEADSIVRIIAKAAGMSGLSEEVRSAALLYFNYDSPHVDLAHHIHSEANAISTHSGTIRDVVTKSLESTLKQRRALRIENRAQRRFIYKDRVKSVGSILEKLESKEDWKHNTVPDSFANRAVVPDPAQGINPVFYIYELSFKALGAMTERLKGIGYVPGHTRETEPAIEINFGSWEDVIKAIPMIRKSNHIDDLAVDEDKKLVSFTSNFGGKRLTITVSSERKSGYQAAHLSGSINGQGIETQITTVSANPVNEDGRASHLLYKAKTALGRLGEVFRGDDDLEKEDYAQRLYRVLNLIRQRSRLMKELARANLNYLSPYTIDQLKSLPPELGFTELIAQVEDTLCPQDYKIIYDDEAQAG